MFREPKKPTFRLKNPRLVTNGIIFGIFIMLFLFEDSFFLFLGIFLLITSACIIAIAFIDYQQKINSFIRRVKKIKDSNITEVDSFTGEKFEYFLKKLFEDLGFRNIKTTQKTRDFGVDLVMFDASNRKIVIQAKRYSKNVSNKAINEVVGTRLPENADEVWVVTNSYFTKPAIEHAYKNKVKLLNRDSLIDLILKSHKNSQKKL